MHTLAMFLGEEGLGMVVAEPRTAPVQPRTKTDVLLNVLDLQGRITSLDHRVQDLLQAVRATPTHH